MSDLEYLTGICQKVLNPLPAPEEDEEEYIDPYGCDEEEPELEPGWQLIQVGWEPWGEPRMKLVREGIRGGI